MPYRLHFACFLILGMLAASGCKVIATVNEGGKLLSHSGLYTCLEGEVCEFDIPTDGYLEEVFVGIPRDGYVFAGWRNARRHFCSGKEGECRLTIDPAKADFEELQRNFGSTFRIEPIFLAEDTLFLHEVDRRIANVSIEGEQITLIGEKNGEGLATSVDRLQLTTDANELLEFYFDESGALTGFVDKDGTYNNLSILKEISPAVLTSASGASTLLTDNESGSAGDLGAAQSSSTEVVGISVRDCGASVPNPSLNTAARLWSRDASGNVVRRELSFVPALNEYQFAFPIDSAKLAAEGLVPACNALGEGMQYVCATKDALVPPGFSPTVSIASYCSITAALAGVGYPACVANLLTLYSTLEVVCGPLGPGPGADDLVTVSCKEIQKTVDIYAEATQIREFRAEATVGTSIPYRRKTSEWRAAQPALPFFNLDVARPILGNGVFTPSEPEIEDGYSLTFPLQCTQNPATGTMVSKRSDPISGDIYDVGGALVDIAAGEESLTFVVPGLDRPEGSVDTYEVFLGDEGVLSKAASITIPPKEVFQPIIGPGNLTLDGVVLTTAPVVPGCSASDYARPIAGTTVRLIGSFFGSVTGVGTEFLSVASNLNDLDGPENVTSSGQWSDDFNETATLTFQDGSLIGVTMWTDEAGRSDGTLDLLFPGNPNFYSCVASGVWFPESLATSSLF